MALTRKSDSNIVYLQVKHFCLWRELKKPTKDCESIEVTNPETHEVITKYGHSYRDITGRAENMVKYDTGKKYSKRYFGFKLHVRDKGELYVIDMPYQSQVLRRFLRMAPNFNWDLPFTLTVFKGKNKDEEPETAVWFQQRSETVKGYYTKEQPHGMPEAIYYQETNEWDFKAQQRWLVEQLVNHTIPAIELAAAKAAPPVQPEAQDQEPEPDTSMIPPSDGISDDDVPF